MYRIVVSCGITSNSTVAGIKKGASNGGGIVLNPVEQLLSLVCIVPVSYTHLTLPTKA